MSRMVERFVVYLTDTYEPRKTSPECPVHGGER